MDYLEIFKTYFWVIPVTWYIFYVMGAIFYTVSKYRTFEITQYAIIVNLIFGLILYSWWIIQ